MRSATTLVAMLFFCAASVVQAQEISFIPLAAGATPGLGELVYDASSNRLFIASGAGEVRVTDLDGNPDAAFATDGTIGNGAPEVVLLDAEYLAVASGRLFIADQAAQQILVVTATTGVLDTSLATDGIIGNDPSEPAFSAQGLHDIEVLGGMLYIATNSSVIRYALDGSDNHSVFSGFPAQTLSAGPLRDSGVCSNNSFAGNVLLYAVAPNELNNEQGTVACIDNTGANEVVAQTGDISLSDLVFATPGGDSCLPFDRFTGGKIIYLASRNAETEVVCMGADGSHASINDAAIGASTGITLADNHLFLRQVGTDGTLYRSELLNQVPVADGQSIDLDENTPNPSLVTTATATDLDPDAVLGNWMIVTGNQSIDDDANVPFSINPSTGEIRVNDAGDLDRELIAGFDLMVTVSDGFSTSEPASILISLNDLNEFSPQIDAHAPVTFNENLANSQPVATITGSDGDATAALQNWTISSGNFSVDNDANLPFLINPASGLITVNDSGDLDAELVGGYSLMITVSDGFFTSAPKSLAIIINDVNEFTPVIDDQSLDIDEGSPDGFPVTIASASDDDGTALLQNWMIVSGNASVDGDADPAFSINPNNGLISINDSGDIDRDLTPGYTLMVTVSDGEKTSLPATIQINITTTILEAAICAPGGNRGVVDIPLMIDTSVRFSGAASFAASGLPASLMIGAGDGVISGTPVADDVAGSPYAVHVTGDGQSFNFKLTIDATNEVIFYSDLESNCVLPPL